MKWDVTRRGAFASRTRTGRRSRVLNCVSSFAEVNSSYPGGICLAYVDEGGGSAGLCGADADVVQR